uniref:Uncharacterized protein n=1 Tax=Tetranychus urticae TaxID=32264 RepID=T1JZX2_TETUR
MFLIHTVAVRVNFQLSINCVGDQSIHWWPYIL